MTALTYVTVTETWGDGAGSSAVSGTVTFTPTSTVYAAGQPLVVPALPVQAQILSGRLQSLDGTPVQLLATDNAGVTVEGPFGSWAWEVTVTVTAGGSTGQDSWEFELPGTPSTVDLYSTRPAA